MEQLLPEPQLPAAQQLRESLFQVYWSRSKRIRLPSRNMATGTYG